MLGDKILRFGLLVLWFLLCFNLSGIVYGRDHCFDISTMTGNWDYPPDWDSTLITTEMETVLRSETWQGTLIAPCPDGLVSLEWSSDDYGDSFGEIDENNTTVHVSLGENACGAFRVIITGCGWPIYGPWVPITDAGEGEFCDSHSAFGCNGPWCSEEYFEGPYFIRAFGGTRNCSYAMEVTCDRQVFRVSRPMLTEMGCPYDLFSLQIYKWVCRP
jgi:hypothetical protein